jgi:hypothetical protein
VHISWPRAGAVEVELDAPLVIASYGTDRVRATLTAEDGSEVPLLQRNRLAAGASGCANDDYWFLTPAAPLAPHTQHTLHVANADTRGLLNIVGPDVSFFTGAALRTEATPELTLSLYEVDSPQRLLRELVVESSSAEPLFVRVQGQMHTQTRMWPRAASAGATPLVIGLGAVECAEPLVVDVTGRVLRSETLCEPSKCAISSLLLGGACGTEPASPFTWQEWQQLPDGCSGSAPAPIDVVSDAAAGSGCQLTAPRATGTAVPAMVYLLACLLRRRGGSRAG